MNTLIKNENNGKYYLTDELTATALNQGDRDEPFYAYLSNKNGDRVSNDMVEVKDFEEEWYLVNPGDDF